MRNLIRDGVRRQTRSCSGHIDRSGGGNSLQANLKSDVVNMHSEISVQPRTHVDSNIRFAQSGSCYDAEVAGDLHVVWRGQCCENLWPKLEGKGSSVVVNRI